MNSLKTRPENELLLLLARRRTDGARAARARELLRADLDWDWLQRTSLRHGVMPLVYRQLCALSDAVPPARLEAFRAKYRLNAVRNTERAGRLCRLLKMFERAGVAALPYKGPALALDAYGDLTLRQFGDLDILIRPDDLRAATGLLSAAGYVPEFELSGAREAAFKRWWYAQPFRLDEEGIYLELHWSVAPRFFSFRLDETLWTRLRTIELAGREVKAMSAADTLLLLCVHGAKDVWAKLEWVCAVAEFSARLGEAEWRECWERARAAGAERMLLVGLTLARELYDAAPPRFLAERAESSRVSKRLAARVVSELFEEEKSFHRFLGRTAFHLRARERAADRARYCALAALATSPAEWDMLALPPGLFFVYSFLRPLRLARNFLTEAKAHAPAHKTGAQRDRI